MQKTPINEYRATIKKRIAVPSVGQHFELLPAAPTKNRSIKNTY